MAAPIRAFIFDMDGTMIDSMPMHKKSWAEFARRHGLTKPIEELMRDTTGRTAVECMNVLFDRKLSLDEALRLAHEKEAVYRKLYAPIFSEVKGFKTFMGRALQQDLAVGVGTAGDAENVAFAFSHLKLNPEPRVVVRGDMGLRGKPEPDIFLEASRQLGVAPEHCVVFEDAPLGIEAARRARMRAVGMTTTYSAAELSGAHVIAAARNYDELLANAIFSWLNF